MAQGKRSGGGYTKVCTLSPELAAVVGQDTMARHEVVKKVWSIIKEQNLYVSDYNMHIITYFVEHCITALMKILKLLDWTHVTEGFSVYLCMCYQMGTLHMM